jgi:hypothetical protein
MSGQYNGWSNYETWLAALWIDNEGYAGGSDEISESAREALRANDGDKDAAADEIADAIRNEIDEMWISQPAGLATDLLRSAVEAVNWHEIARNYIEQAQEGARQEA